MPLINVPDIQNNDAATPDLWNSRFGTITNLLNGSLDADNLANLAVTAAKLASSSVTTAKLADDAVTAAKLDWASTGVGAGIWGEELGRTTLSVAGDTITVAIPARKYLTVIVSLVATGGTVGAAFQFNGDTSSSYGRRAAADGGTEATQTSQTSTSVGSTIAGNMEGIITINNIATRAKFLRGQWAYGDNTAGTAPSRNEFVGKWANTTNQITSISCINSGTGDFAIGSEVIVVGHD